MTTDLEIICVGNELLIGKIKDTNAHYIAKRATQLGVNVKRVTIIQDTIPEIASAICEAVERKPNFIITTGGLGPTFDDKTLQGLSEAIGQKVELNQKALAMVKQKLADYAQKRGLSRDIDLTPPRIKMAMLPKKTEPVNNPVGTAPGVRADMQGTVLFVLPGVPNEMEAILNETIEPLIKQTVGDKMFCERSIFADNIMESRLAPIIDQVMRDNLDVYIKSHPMQTENKPHIELHLTITVSKKQKPQEKLIKAAKELTDLVEKNGGLVTSEF
ncbi:MAG: molybdopterin-binding protein [Ignavibacteria bacterium]